MNKLLAVTLSAFALVFVGGGLVVPAVTYAQDATETSITDSIKNRTKARVNEQKEAATKKRAELQTQAETKLKEAKQNKELRTTEVRQKACESRKSALSNKIKATSAAAQRHLDTIDSFNVKLEAYITKYSLDKTVYSEKQAAVVSAREVADTAVGVLNQASDNGIDCSEIDAATTNALAYKEALKQAREALKSYRKATKDLLVAIKTSAEAKESESSDSDASDQESTGQEDADSVEDTTNQEPVN